MIKFVSVLMLGFGAIYASNISYDRIQYFRTSTISLKDTSETKIDPINDSVYQVKSSEGTPLYYYTLLNTGVCFDNKCRPLSILLYWNITGRYLGFELPHEEFLSKYDHEPFTPTEYALLDSLLANPFLPLKNYSFYDLVDTTASENPETDGVSGATSQDVMDYIVPEAAYTTYKLWNVIYGPIRDAVIMVTENQLDVSLFSKILQSSVSADRIWAAERIDLLGDLDSEMIDRIVGFVRAGEYSESYIALKTITPQQLNSEYLQTKLFDLIGKVDYSIENQLFDKLKEADRLSPNFVHLSISSLGSLNDNQLISLLKLFKHHHIKEDRLSSLLRERSADSENKYVKSQIMKFLMEDMQ